MNLIAHIRNELGLRQEALAALLQVTLPQLKMAESQGRSLHPEAMQRLVLCWEALKDLPTPPRVPGPSPTFYTDLHRLLRRKKERLEGILDQARKREATMQRRLQFLAKLEQAGEPATSMIPFPFRDLLRREVDVYMQSDEREKLAERENQWEGLAAMLRALEKNF